MIVKRTIFSPQNFSQSAIKKNSTLLDFSKDDIEIPLGGAVMVIRRVKKAEEPLAPRTPHIKSVIKARNSYQVYGEVPCLDAYDIKSCIYIAEIGEEIISIRFVLAHNNFGGPISTEDLEHNGFEKNNSDKVIPLKNILKDENISTNQCGTISRVSTTRPGRRGRLLKDKYMAAAFAAIQLMITADARRYKVDCITCQGHPTLKTVITAVGDHQLDFTPAEETLDLHHSGKIRLNRNSKRAWQYFIKYPGYFLNSYDICQLSKLYFGSNFVYNSVHINDLNWRNIKAWTPILTTKNCATIPCKINKKKLTQFREDLHLKVRDAVNLYIMKVDNWEKSALKQLQLAQQTLSAQEKQENAAKRR